ncbi:carbon storage regulator [Candidatus Dependentiae bacterium]|nr:MAG: carbon storage regulator [Candidatus Dependentiae bacterium]
MKTKKEYGTLAIAAKEGDSITIGDEILLIYAKQVSKKQIKIVFKAPKSVRIVRHGAIIKEEKE